MAWYYWLYIAIAIVWFLDVYSTATRSNPQNIYADLILRPILIAFLSAVWPLSFLYLLFGKKKKAVSGD
jgi:hypothetical protein